jgi:REP element-mobilizing transposase RayT
MIEHHPYFFTATINGWKHLLKPDKYKDIIIESLRFIVQNKRAKVYGFVIMPNHLHLIWQVMDGVKYENLQRDFLKFTAQRIKFDLIEKHPKVLEMFKSDNKDRRYQIWKYNSLSIELFSQTVFTQKLDYIHNNPIQEKWNLATNIEDYKYSSASFYYSGDNKYDFITHFRD